MSAPVRRRPSGASRTRRASRPAATRPGTCPCSRASRRSASAPACTSGPPTPAGSCTACGRSSTTRSTRRWPGTATAIEVVLHADGSVEVRDDGRGIPVDVEPKTGLTGVEVVMTRLHAGGKFGGGSYAAVRRSARRRRLASSTRCPRGSTSRSTATARSTRCRFRRGVPGVFDGRRSGRAVQPRRPGCAVAGKVAKKGVTGTRVRCWADRQIFLKDAAFASTSCTRGPADRVPRARA